MELKQGGHIELLLVEWVLLFSFFSLICQLWSIISFFAPLGCSFFFCHIHLFLFFHPRLHPMHLFFSHPLMVHSGPTLSCSYFKLWSSGPQVFVTHPHSTSLLSVALHLCYLCVVFRLPRFLQQSAQSGTSSALGLPRTPHRSHLWRTCLPQQGPYEEPKSEPGAGHRPLPQQYR